MAVWPLVSSDALSRHFLLYFSHPPTLEFIQRCAAAHFGVATIHRTFGVCLLIIWPHGFSVLFYMSDCSHWKQIVYTLEIQGIHQPISEKSIGYKPCMMSARTYVSTVMQGAGLSVSKWLDHTVVWKWWDTTQDTFVRHDSLYMSIQTLPDVCENVCVHGQARGMKWGTIFWKLLRKSFSHHSISLEFPRVLSKVGRRNRPPILLVDWLHSCCWIGISFRYMFCW
jgi:hypothetical protein